MSEAACAGYDGGACTAGGPIAGETGMGIQCPNCGGQACRTDKGDVFVCEKGRPLMREARCRCRRCGSTVILIERCEPKGAGHD